MARGTCLFSFYSDYSPLAKEGLWTEDEKVSRPSRQEVEDAEVAEAEEVLEVDDAEVTELSNNSLFSDSGAHQIVLPREVDKSFFVKLKALLEKHPGKDRLELVIGEKVLPLPTQVKWNEELKGLVNEMIDG